MGLFSRKKKSEMKEYPKEQRDLFREGIKLSNEAPDFTILLPNYILPPKNIRILIFSESVQAVRDWVNQLSIILNENGIHTQLNENELIFQIYTFNEEVQEWVPAIIFSPNEVD